MLGSDDYLSPTLSNRVSQKESPRVADTLILIVDDDPLIRASVAAGLEFWNLRVTTASDGQDALEEIEKEQPTLIILDLNMPILDGRGFAREIQRRGLQIPIVLMSAVPDAEDAAKEIGAVAWLDKPFDLDRLFASIQRFMYPCA